jgi:hypothetical protein
VDAKAQFGSLAQPWADTGTSTRAIDAGGIGRRRLYVMGHGRIVFEGTPADIEVNADVRKEWLEV